MTLPQGWKEKPLGDYFEFQQKSKRKAGDGKESGDYKFFTSSSIQKKFMDEFDFDGEFLIFGTGGGASIHYCNDKFSTSTDCFIVRVKPEVKTEYIYYFIRAHIHILQAGFKGAGLKHVSKGYMQEMMIKFPTDIKVQEKIIALLKKAEQIKDWRKEADGLSKDYLKSVFVDMFGDPIINPKKHPTEKLGKTGELKRGKSKHRPRNDPVLLGGTHPLIQTGDVAGCDGYIRKYNHTYSDIGLKQSMKWPKGTLCITIAANIGKTGILTFDACFPDSVVGFKPGEKVTTEYIQYWLSFLQNNLEKMAPQSAQKNINLEILRDIDLMLPPKPLQDKFSKIVVSFEIVKQNQKETLTKSNDLFKSLMQKAFKGALI
jgi:type I restriction enzyme, S subunit